MLAGFLPSTFAHITDVLVAQASNVIPSWSSCLSFLFIFWLNFIVCPPLAFSADKVIATQTTDGSEIKYELSCPAGKLFAKINGTITPATEYTCSPDTGYNWVPKNVTAQCTCEYCLPLK